MTNREEIIRALRLLFSEGDVFEVRILKAVTGGYQRPHTESGYFDFEHIPQAADAIAKIRSFAGAYVTLNPVDPDLLARAFNRIGPAEQNATTADDDVSRRRWLPIDCDAVRKSNISSTDEEHAAALELADQIRNGLASLGWPQPIVLDSGNGAQLLYRIDLPAKDDGLVQNVIASIAAASTEQVHVDLTVFNPARIWRIPGTMNCKGDSIPNRPHRMANIVSVPDKLQTVSREMMIAAAGGEKEQPPQTMVVSNPGFVLDDWILRHGLDVKSPVPYNGGRKWVFKVCPFNPQHTNGSAVLIEEPSGAIGFRCHHNSCSGNDWRKLREMYEPGCYDKPKTQASVPQPADVDISGIVKKKEESDTSSDEESEVVLKLAPFPKELYHVPGFIHDVMKFCLDTAPSPQPELAFASAIALQGHLAGRKVECLDGIRTNTYIIMLAPSGSGKNHPRRIIRKILSRIGLGDEVFEDAASGQGIEDYLIAKPRLLWLSDEIYEMLQQIAYELNQEGIKTNTDKWWDRGYIYRILNNYTYAGKVFYEGHVYPGEHEAIIDDKTWELTRAFMKANMRSPEKPRRVLSSAALGGIIRCGHCNSMMGPVKSKRWGRVYHYYHCKRDSKRDVSICPVKQIPSGEIEELVCQEVTPILKSPEVIAAVSRVTGIRPKDIVNIIDDSFWVELTPLEKQSLFRILVEHVTVTEDGAVIELRTENIKSIQEAYNDPQDS